MFNLDFIHSITINNLPLQWMTRIELFSPDLEQFPLMYIHKLANQQDVEIIGNYNLNNKQRIFGFVLTTAWNMPNTHNGLCDVEINFICNIPQNHHSIYDNLIKEEIEHRIGIADKVSREDLPIITNNSPKSLALLQKIWDDKISAVYGDYIPHGRIFDEVYGIIRFSASGNAPKLGKISEISKILVSDEIYTDSSKGNRATNVKLTQVFKTQDSMEIAKIIMKKGELNLTTEQRKKMTAEKKKQIVTFISKTYVDPKTHLPHPPLRIEQAMTDGRVSIDPFKNADDQINDIVEKLRSIIPLKTENLVLEISVPAQFVAQSYTVLKSTGTLKKEDWQPNGSLKAILEIPAAARPNVIDRLGAITKGTAFVEVIQ